MPCKCFLTGVPEIRAAPLKQRNQQTAYGTQLIEMCCHAHCLLEETVMKMWDGIRRWPFLSGVGCLQNLLVLSRSRGSAVTLLRRFISSVIFGYLCEVKRCGQRWLVCESVLCLNAVWQKHTGKKMETLTARVSGVAQNAFLLSWLRRCCWLVCGG